MCASDRCGGLPSCGESEQRLGKCHNFGRLLLIPRKREESVIFTHAHSPDTDREFPQKISGQKFSPSYLPMNWSVFGVDQKVWKIKVGCGKHAGRLRRLGLHIETNQYLALVP